MAQFRARGQLPFTKKRLQFWFDKVKEIASRGEVPPIIQAMPWEDCLNINIEKGLLSQVSAACDAIY